MLQSIALLIHLVNLFKRLSLVKEVSRRSGKPSEEILEQFALDTVEEILANDAELKTLINNLEATLQTKTNVKVRLNGKITLPTSKVK
jgi:hypothetical protein